MCAISEQQERRRSTRWERDLEKEQVVPDRTTERPGRVGFGSGGGKQWAKCKSSGTGWRMRWDGRGRGSGGFVLQRQRQRARMSGERGNLGRLTLTAHTLSGGGRAASRRRRPVGGPLAGALPALHTTRTQNGRHRCTRSPPSLEQAQLWSPCMVASCLTKLHDWPHAVGAYSQGSSKWASSPLTCKRLPLTAHCLA